MALHLREYQLNILKTCLKRNTLVILPTGTGKTYIAFALIINRVEQYKNQKIFFLAPTKPLVLQHYRNFIKLFPEFRSKCVAIVGDIKPEKRETMYKAAQIVFVTPQTLQNDLIEGRVSFYDASTIIFDEAHKAVGKYAYVFIAKKFVEQSKNPRIIGLTASPGWRIERIQEIVENLAIEDIEIRTGHERDIYKYIQKVYIEKIEILLSDDLLEIKKLLDKALELRWEKLKELGYSKAYGKKELLELMKDLRKKFATTKDQKYSIAIQVLGEIIKLEHALELLETQTLYTFVEYFKELDERATLSRSQALKSVLNDIRVKKARYLANKLVLEGREHPKLEKLIEIIKENKDKKIIVFAQIRKTVDRIKEFLEKNGIACEKFTGKKEMKREDQIRILSEFSEGKFNVLISTSVGEEGIDIPKVDLVIFYEPVPSEIRYIQRRGRTGRTEIGKVIILVTRKTRDETFFWVAINKERKMLKFVKNIKKHIKLTMAHDSEIPVKEPSKHFGEVGPITKFLTEKKRTSPEDKKESIEFLQKKTVPVIVADYREKDSGLVQALAEMGVVVKLEKLDVGDYLIGDLVIERKTIIDFISSLMDNRLFEQLQKLCKFNSILILEGEEDLLSEAGVNPNYIRSILLSILLKYKIPIIRTSNFIDTANYLYLLAKNGTAPQLISLASKPKNLNEVKLEILKQIPGIGESLAKKLLERFRSLKGVFTASKVELANIVGEAKADRIKKVFEEEYK